MTQLDVDLWTRFYLGTWDLTQRQTEQFLEISLRIFLKFK